MINSKSKDNVMFLIYIAKLGFTTQKTNVKVEKIHDFPLKIGGLASVMFLLWNNVKRI